ncbi:MAG: UDP-N-acetylmuramoyl-tripeptide--D-alanyl-D-alanine ligase [Microbacteriaceae bacterium]|nr:UDP-N-acetylmuramoyl-tripeptide--D-alanyl-D-alanine ligase [Microbacteriaceae bacterium]
MTLADIARAVGGILALPDGVPATTIVAGAVVTDSRTATAGSIFFALPGGATDGMLFAGSAVASGATLVIAERPVELPVATIVVTDGVAALASLARAVVAAVRAHGLLRIVGITGSNGKTTTKNMLRAILSAHGPTVAPQGSYNNHVGAPLTMLSIDDDTRFLVIEMGASAEGDIAGIIDIVVPDISVVLKVGLAHAGEFGGIEATQRAKSEIVTRLPADAVAVLNRDDGRVAAMAPMTAARPLWFGLDDAADVRADDLRATAAGTSFVLHVGDWSRTVTLRILGEHHVMNALAALAVAHELGLPLDAACEALEGIERAERWRMEILRAPNGVVVINDGYNASPDSTAAALKTLAQIVEPGQRSIAILGEMNELGEYADEEHDRIGRLVVRLNIQKLVVVGHGARHIHNAAGLEGSWDGESVLVATSDEAYDLLDGQLRAGDVVLVKSSNASGLRFLGDRLGGVTQ